MYICLSINANIAMQCGKQFGYSVTESSNDKSGSGLGCLRLAANANICVWTYIRMYVKI